MLFRSIDRGLLAGLGLACLTLSTSAQETGWGTTTNPPGLRTLIKSEDVIEATNAKPIQRAYFNVGTNRFAFVVPEDFQLDASNPSKIILTSPDYTCFIAVQLMSFGAAEGGAVMVESFRNLALDEFPAGAMVREFDLRAANKIGSAYEFRWKNSNGGQQLGCVGFVPSRAGLLKFSLLSNSEKYPDNQLNFRCLLRSFQSNELGKLEILPVSGAS